MSVIVDLNVLLEWLGPAGVKAGLQSSKLSLKELVDLAKKQGLPLSPKPTREEISNEIAFANVRRIERSIDVLLSMDQAELAKFLKETKPSRSEVIGILSGLGIQIGSEASKSLYAFAAREISDMGMYQRVARGKGVSPDQK